MPPITRAKSNKNYLDSSNKGGEYQLNIPSSGSVGGRTRRKSSDSSSIILLVVLYLLQGVPLGLAMGSLPYILKSKLSYSELAMLSLSQYPYSLKVLMRMSVAR